MNLPPVSPFCPPKDDIKIILSVTKVHPFGDLHPSTFGLVFKLPLKKRDALVDGR
jgi:hypothetical protein